MAVLALFVACQALGQSRTKPTPAAVNVTICDVLADPAAYKDRAVRFTAVYRQAGEDFVALECPGCEGGLWRPHFEDTFDSCTPSEVREKFDLDVTLVVRVVGRVVYGVNDKGKPYVSSFRIACAEKAEKVGHGAGKDLERPKVKRLVNCAVPKD